MTSRTIQFAAMKRLIDELRRVEGIAAEVQARQGDKGDKGDAGAVGRPPRHEWRGTKLRFENPDGTWGEWVDLQGFPGIGSRGVGAHSARIEDGQLVLYLTSGERIVAGDVGGGGGDAFGNMSRYHIPSGETVRVPEGYNFLVVGGLELDGVLEVDGRVVELAQ